jgi:hypothetical protein
VGDSRCSFSIVLFVEFILNHSPLYVWRFARFFSIYSIILANDSRATKKDIMDIVFLFFVFVE